MRNRNLKKSKKRAKNVDADTRQRIVRILEGWTGTLTWEALIDEVHRRIHQEYTRQALYGHREIYAAFKDANERLDEPKTQNGSGSSVKNIFEQTIEKLKSENARLKRENEFLVEKFVRWAYNAHARGITEAVLNEPLPRVDRNSFEKTDKGKGAVAKKR